MVLRFLQYAKAPSGMLVSFEFDKSSSSMLEHPENDLSPNSLRLGAPPSITKDFRVSIELKASSLILIKELGSLMDVKSAVSPLTYVTGIPSMSFGTTMSEPLDKSNFCKFNPQFSISSQVFLSVALFGLFLS